MKSSWDNGVLFLLIGEAEPADVDRNTLIVSPSNVPCSSSTHTDTSPSASLTVYSVSVIDTIRSVQQNVMRPSLRPEQLRLTVIVSDNDLCTVDASTAEIAFRGEEDIETLICLSQQVIHNGEHNTLRHYEVRGYVSWNIRGRLNSGV